MSFFSENFLSQFGDGGGGGGFLGIISAGPSAWSGSSGMWSSLGSRVGFEVDINGVLGNVHAGSLAERAQAAEQANEVFVLGPSQQAVEGAEGEGVRVLDLGNGTIYDIWDGGSTFSFAEVPVQRPSDEWFSPEPTTPDWPPLLMTGLDPYQADPAMDVHWQPPAYWQGRDGMLFQNVDIV